MWEPTLIALLSPGLIAAPQTRNHTLTVHARMCARPTAKWSLVLWVRYPLGVCMWGCCGGVLLSFFPEKSIIYLELSQCCVVFCQRGLPMVQKPSHRPGVYRLAFTRVKCCFSCFFLMKGLTPRGRELTCTPLCQPAASCDLKAVAERWGWTQNHLEPISPPQIHTLKEQTVWLF